MRESEGRVRWFATLLLAVGLGAAAAHAQTSPSAVGEWRSVATWPIVAIHAHLLPTGKVMVWPGDGGISGNDPRLWDPATDTMTFAAKPGYNVFCAGHSYLGDGRLLVSGGHIQNDVGLPNASLYDAVTNSWARLPDMTGGRWYPTNTTLAGGGVLVVSGTIDLTQGANPLPQVFEPASGSWRSLTSALLKLPKYPFMHLAPNGKVFNAGPALASRYLDTSGTGAWTTVAPSNFGWRGYGSSVLYDEGKVLLVGGGDPPTATAEVIDLKQPTPVWRYTAAMSVPRGQLNATVLPDGKVLATGGTSGAGFNNPTTPVYAAEQWDPVTETWTTLASMQSIRIYHSFALLLPDGRVLSAGGNGHPETEVFSPPYLFQGPRPTVSSAATRATWGQTFHLETPNYASIAQVTLIPLSSVTHAFNQNQRFNRLRFTPVAGALEVTTPSGPTVAPPGRYMLFVLNGLGVPSIARMIDLGGTANAVPAAPSGLRATATAPDRIALAWTDNASNETGFEIERATLSGPFTVVARPAANLTSWTSSGLLPSTTYVYRLRAVNGNGSSAASNEGVATTPTALPAAPSGLQVAAIQKDRIDLAWTDNASNELGFRVERSHDGTQFAEIAVLPANAGRYTATGLRRNRVYYFRVRAFNASGASAYSNTVSARTKK